MVIKMHCVIFEIVWKSTDKSFTFDVAQSLFFNAWRLISLPFYAS